MRRALLCSIAAVGMLAALAEPVDAPARPSRDTVMPADYLLGPINRYRKETWRWQRLMSKPRTPAGASARRSSSPAYRRWVLQTWKRRALVARRKAANPPRKAAWLCLQRHEARWNDPNPPYYGGLQMDLGFQRTYGAHLLRKKGTADNWTPIEQMWVAERAYRSGRGFYPWPNTARYCGLL
jgi:hypothetical protein